MNVKEMIYTYSIRPGATSDTIRIYRPQAAIKDGMVDTIKAHKPEILAYFREQDAAEEARHAAWEAREEKIAAIDGLAEIVTAREELAEWRRKFNASFDSEDGGGFGVGPMPKHDIGKMLSDHPRAAAYLKAEAMAGRANTEMAAIGKRALDRIINGDDYTQALADMKAELDAFADRHTWD